MIGAGVVAAAGVAVTTSAAAAYIPAAARPKNLKTLTLTSPVGTVNGAPPLSVTFQGNYQTRRTRTPIPNATIYLNDDVDGRLSSGLTDSNGNYSITYPFTTDGTFVCTTSDV